MTHAVGIDLGTTHTVVAWAPLNGSAAPRILPIPQYASAAELARLPWLPSYLYAPMVGESVPEAADDGGWVSGEYARRRGVEVPGRTVSSAKSWLCHAGVDREAPILPWGGRDDVSSPRRISPVDASARYLMHIRRAWEQAFPTDPLASQDIVLTVPASFDEVSRELTVEAARRAGFSARLLEEPQAAFYDYLVRVGQDELTALASEHGEKAMVLVCDVGGGTTDLSLIRVDTARDSGRSTALTLDRVAVGKHLLLGGDNMDLALAHLCESKLLPPPDALDSSRFAALLHACRAAKERILAPDGPAACRVSVLGAGAHLVGNALSVELTRQDVTRVVLDGFFPPCPPNPPRQPARAGLIAFGLPYERDVAITRHVAQFFARHAPGAGGPAAILLNGGVFRSPTLVGRLVEVLSSWGGPPPTLLRNPDPDVAVARGAVSYALARHGVGRRIGGGASRGYYIGLAGPDARARRAVCVLPRGGEEGMPYVAADKPMGLLVGRPVRFELFASSEASHRAGDVVAVDDERFERLPPVAATFEASGSGRARPSATSTRSSSIPASGVMTEEVQVALQAELTALGTLELSCVEVGNAPASRRFQLELDLHAIDDKRVADGRGATQGLVASGRIVSPERAPGPRLDEAKSALLRVFGRGRHDVGTREAGDLVRELDRILGERTRWTTSTVRALFDVLVPNARARKRSADHERIFWQLAGFCLRPGCGDPLDPARIAQIMPLLPEKIVFAAESRNWQQLWIAFRRIAGGLDEATQEAIRDVLDPFIAPAEERLKAAKGWKGDALDDIVDLASQLERAPVSRRARLGGWILERTWTSRDPRLWAALGRVGARVPVYASAHHVVSPLVAERWIDHLLREKWEDLPTASNAAVQLGRVTGDRARDVSERVRAQLARRLVAAKASAEQVRAVEQLVPLPELDRTAFFGESLPVGLTLLERTSP
jgi:molecular chaperone DnaK (HSP70)